MARTIYLISVLFVLINADEAAFKLNCDPPCILKCCSFNQHYDESGNCIDSVHNLSYDDFDVYDEHMRLTGKKLGRDIHLTSMADTNITIAIQFKINMNKHNTFFNIYLLENGISYLEKINAMFRWIERKQNKFCIEYSLENGSLEPTFNVEVVDLFENSESENEDKNWSNVLSYGLLISMLCLLVVIVVYCLLPELRNLGGKILMAYAGSLFLSYLFLFSLRTIINGETFAYETCYALTFSIYFWLLASFFWMNVMSFDIWWTFRGYAKARPIHRRGENFKFFLYSLYAFGGPLLMTGMVIYLYFADLSYTPWFIKPELICFFKEEEKMLYLYMPMLFLILWNWVFFLLTAYNVWRLSRNVASVLNSGAAGKPSDHQQQRNRLMVYLKLSAVMGTSWVLEVMCYFIPYLKYVHIQDIYHSLIGLVIMLIFVCKKKIIKKLRYKLLSDMKHPKWGSYTKRSSFHTSDSDVSQDTPMQICPNPKGFSYQPNKNF